MYLSLHQTKRTNELREIFQQSIDPNKKIFDRFNVTQSIERKNLFKNHQLTHSQSNLNMTKSLVCQSSISKSSTKVNKLVNHNIFPGSKISQKMLTKSKKYFRLDIKMKQNQDILQNDIQNLLQNLQTEKQKNDIIIINLRDKFQSHKKQLKKKLNLKLRNLQRKVFSQKQNTLSKINYQTIKLKQINTINNLYIDQQQEMNRNHSEFFNKSRIFNLQVKKFKNQLKNYINSLKSKSQNNSFQITRRTNDRRYRTVAVCGGEDSRNQQQVLTKQLTRINKVSNSHFKQYTKLAQKSYDTLEMLLKSTLVSTSVNNYDYECGDNRYNLPRIPYTRQQIQQALNKINNKLTLSVLKFTYKCLQSQYNSKQIINKILLALRINPLNEFFFIKQQTFTLFKKLITGQSSQRQSKQFLLSYFCLDHEMVKREHFYSSVCNILKKLTPYLNERTVEYLYQRWRNIVDHLVKIQMKQNQNNSLTLNDTKRTTTSNTKNQSPKQLQNQQYFFSRKQIKSILFNDPQFLWDEILRLIFLV